MNFSIGPRLRTAALTAMLPLALLLGAAPSYSQPPSPPTYYDEVFDAQGNVRPHYRGVFEIYSKMSNAEKKRFLRATKKDFRGDNALDPLPRLIPKSEFEELRKGVEQRGTALRMFLQDYYGGGKSWEKVIPPATLGRILARNGEQGFYGIVRPDQIAFPYGPDIIRTASGSWAVIEDNPGFIGGPGDLKMALDTLFRNKPEYKDAIRVQNDPMDYYREQVRRARQRAIPKDGKIVLYMTPPYADNEDVRLRKIYQELGVEVITPHTKSKLEVTSKGVFVKASDPASNASPERVGFMIVNGEHKWLDSTHPLARDAVAAAEADFLLQEKTTGKRLRAQLQEIARPDPATGRRNTQAIEAVLKDHGEDVWIREIRAANLPGLNEAILQGKVATNYSPGLDFIGDKEFYTYVDDLVRHYLKEEPVVTNLATQRFMKPDASGVLKVDEELMDRLFKKGEYKNNVIKIVDGRGGDGVYIGPKLKKSDIPDLIRKIRERPEAFIAQSFTPLSRVEDRIVDQRMVTIIDPMGAYVARTPWGRGVPATGDGKVNLSKKGREFAILVVDDVVAAPPSCLRTSRTVLENLSK